MIVALTSPCMPFHPFSRKTVASRNDASDRYAGLRRLWLFGEAVSRAPAGLGPSDVVAVLVDWEADGGFATTLAAEDGTASIYTSRGWAMVGAGFHALTAAAALALVGCAQSYVGTFPLTDQFPLPKRGYRAYRIVTRGGVRSAEFAESEMMRDEFLSPLLEAEQRLVTRMRLMDGLRVKGAMHPQTLRLHVFRDGGLCLVTPPDPDPTWLTARQLQRVLEIAKSQGDRLEVSSEPSESERTKRALQTVEASGIAKSSPQSPPPIAYHGGTQTLHYAITIARTDLVADMIERGASLEARDDLGYTPLILAAFKGRVAALRLLVGAGANTKALDRKGNSPLMFAAQWGDLNAVRLLLDAGADPMVRGEKGYTALRIARLSNQLEVAEFLAAKGFPE